MLVCFIHFGFSRLHKTILCQNTVILEHCTHYLKPQGGSIIPKRPSSPILTSSCILQRCILAKHSYRVPSQITKIKGCSNAHKYITYQRDHTRSGMSQFKETIVWWVHNVKWLNPIHCYGYLVTYASKPSFASVASLNVLFSSQGGAGWRWGGGSGLVN